MQSYPDFVSWPFDNLILHRTWRRIWSRNPAHEGGWDQSDKRDRGWRGSFVRCRRDNRIRFVETGSTTGLNGDEQVDASCIFDRVNSRINDRVFWCFNDPRRRFPLIHASSAVAVRGRTLILWRCIYTFLTCRSRRGKCDKST